MNSVFAALNEYRVIVGALLTTLMLLVAIVKWWRSVEFWWLNFSYSFPVLGKISRLSGDIMPPGKDGWFYAEKSLASDYHRYYQEADKDGVLFEQCQDYLGKANEIGRNTLHVLGWLLITLLVFVEALGFSYVLSGYTIPGASEQVQQMGAMGIAFLVSVLLVGLTHWTGHELHKNSLIKKIRAWYNHSAGTERRALAPNNQIRLSSTTVDDADPQYQHLLNRVDTNSTVTPSYHLTIATIIFVAIVATGATYVRGQVLEQGMIQETMASSEDAYSDPYAERIPPELIATQTMADDKAVAEEQSAVKKGGWGTFVVLAVIFIFLQVFGVLLGYKKGFAGKQSKEASHYIDGFKSKEQFVTYYERKKNLIARIAQSKLQTLQQKLANTIRDKSTEPASLEAAQHTSARDFHAYVELNSSKSAPATKHPLHDNQFNLTREHNELVPEAQQPSVITEAPAAPHVRQSVNTMEEEIARAKEEFERVLREKYAAEQA
jgi:hypothetical protein